MDLNEWSSTTKRAIFADLSLGGAPSVGEFNSETLKEAQALGKPQVGATVYKPTHATFEYVYTGSNTTIVFEVTVASPERIVYLPVPNWVIESIWQGEVSGSHHFESVAVRLLREFEATLAPEPNAPLFGRKQPTRRE